MFLLLDVNDTLISMNPTKMINTVVFSNSVANKFLLDWMALLYLFDGGFLFISTKSISLISPVFAIMWQLKAMIKLLNYNKYEQEKNEETKADG